MKVELTVRPVDKPEENIIWVAFNQVCRCPEPISSFGHRGPRKPRAPGLWEGCL